MRFWGEFKTFAVRGNVMERAAGVVVGAAFGRLVTSPPDLWLTGTHAGLRTTQFTDTL